MKICLLGYGRMGKEVERVALLRNHEIVGKLNDTCGKIPHCDVVIEFTRPDVAYNNIIQSVSQGIPIVSGTTGWLSRWDMVTKYVVEQGGTLFYASNFSVGVYLFRQINKTMAKLMNHYPNYQPSIEEIHHIHKLDYPSGTALTIANDMLKELDQKAKVVTHLGLNNMRHTTPDELLITSIRQGEVLGIHTVKYESSEDVISISHQAKGRSGLALGAVLAAEFVYDKKGVFGMDDLIRWK